ncbi:MAG TPA: polyphosphate kinase 1 [Flavobacteriales bacterium]|nr:polyphosphate kinase 1 [Flavobacteriales bacterium]
MAKNDKTRLKEFETINRDLSWLSFNARVLQEANDDRVPLIERLRFLGIYSNNQDEFFRIRVASLQRMDSLPAKAKKQLGFDPRKILDKVFKIVVEQQMLFEQTFAQIIKKLQKKGIYHINEKDLTPKQSEFVKNYFSETVRPALVPIMLGKKSKFPDLKDKAIYLAIKLSYKKKKEDFRYSLIEVPAQVVSRFLVVPDQNKGCTNVILLDDVIRHCLFEIYSIFDYDKIEAYTIKITRDSELDVIEDYSKGIVEKLSRGLKKRKKGEPVRFIYDQQIPKDLLEFILDNLDLEANDQIIAGGRYHNFKDFIKFPNVGTPDLVNEPLPPVQHKHLHNKQSILGLIKQRDILISFPYQSFSYIIDLLREAAIDPKVKAIKINLYRVAERSKIINALLNAAKNGKDVTVIIELQARFDEENNIKMATKLEEEGVKVIYGVQGLKVHSKLISITRVEHGKEVLYAHVGTGNFHEANARVYCDHSFLTADPRITKEVAKVFTFFSANYQRGTYRYLFVSPFNTRTRFIELINNEIKNARRRHDAYITIKLNNLTDPELINKLYEAGKAGVKVRLIIRGMCSLIPGVKGLSENIEGVSIVDRFLEHSRVMIFCNDGNELIYLSSADWMERNLDRRVEVTVPIFDSEVRAQIRNVIGHQLKGTAKARILDKDQSNIYKFQLNPKKEQYRSQIETYLYFKSLSPQ